MVQVSRLYLASDALGQNRAVWHGGSIPFNVSEVLWPPETAKDPWTSWWKEHFNQMCCLRNVPIAIKRRAILEMKPYIYISMYTCIYCIRWFDILKVLVAFGRFTVLWSHQILIRFNKQMWLHKLAKCLTTTGYLVLTKLCGARFVADPCSVSILKNPGFLAGCFPPVQPPMKVEYWLSITSCVHRSCFFW